MERFYLTTAIPYVNARPHVGHALEFVEADVIARHERSRKKDVYFLSGTDENAIKNLQAAEKEGISVEKFVAQNSGAFEELLKALNVSHDQFIRTTDKKHKAGAQALWRATAKEDLYKKTYRGLYCIGCEQFYESDELNERGECSEHPGKKLETVEEENYFFKLSRYEGWLRELIESDRLKIVPEVRKNEILAFIKKGLKDFSVSRPIQRTHGWGVSVPDEPHQTMYVWYDALANYITALGYPDAGAELFKKYWAKSDVRLHVIGKGISRFHTVYWPAMLKSAGLPIPTVEFVHGYVTTDGQKISKTLGNVIDPSEIIKKYGADPLRYYLLREIPAYTDGDFTFRRLEERYNADLANGLGNFAARVLALGEQVGDMAVARVEREVDEKIKEEKEILKNKLEEFKFHESIGAIWDLIKCGDEMVNDKKPWAIEGREEKAAAVFNLVAILDNVAVMLNPFLPETAAKITESIQWSGDTVRVRKGGLLFPRLK